MRHVFVLSALFLAGLPVAAHAQLPGPVPTVPTVTTVTVPTLTTPTVPLPPPPTPTVPLPPTPTPTVPLPPAPTPTVPSAPSVPTTPTATAPAPAPAPVPQAPSSSPPVVSVTGSLPGATMAGSAAAGSTTSGSATSGAAAGPGRSGRGGTATSRRSAITFGFRVATARRVRIGLTQVSPVCRNAGFLQLHAVRGANRVRYDGRAGSRPLPDGTYVARTPSGGVRFAIVRGKPTRDRQTFAPSVCGSTDLLSDGRRSGLIAGSGAAPTPPAADSDDAPADAVRNGVEELPRVLGTTLAEAAEAAASLHPAFYVLLALAIAALATATLPPHILPAPAAAAALARRRAELTVGGTLALLTVVVAYWFALV